MRIWLVMALAAGLTLGAGSACRGRGDDLSAADAAAALSATPGFTTRDGSLVGRRLVEVTMVRRIGRSSTEVAFTWRDYPMPPGETGALKTSMALFRVSDEGRWELAAFYKID
jgi:hypothetical protein